MASDNPFAVRVPMTPALLTSMMEQVAAIATNCRSNLERTATAQRLQSPEEVANFWRMMAAELDVAHGLLRSARQAILDVQDYGAIAEALNYDKQNGP